MAINGKAYCRAGGGRINPPPAQLRQSIAKGFEDDTSWRIIITVITGFNNTRRQANIDHERGIAGLFAGLVASLQVLLACSSNK